MMEQFSCCTTTIKIPLAQDSKHEFVEIFPDEIPIGQFDSSVEREVDVNDVLDILRSVYAPLKEWRTCAVS